MPLTVLIMEVTCYSSMFQIIDKAQADAGSTLPVSQVVVATNGHILHDQLK